MMFSNPSFKARMTKSFALAISLTGLLISALAWGQDGLIPKHVISGMWVWSDGAYKTSEQRARLYQVLP
jgi:hypothetical protein